MKASWGWINFSSKDRDNSLAIMTTLKGRGVVDELGIGVSRDIISDSLFPGLSTIQTRAKYFLFTPVIVGKYRRDKPNESLVKYFEYKEGEFLEDMAETYRGKDVNGIFGVTLEDAKDLQRKPSSIYWNGQQVLGIINNKLHNKSLRNYLEQNSISGVDDLGHEEDSYDINHDHSGLSIDKNLISEFDTSLIELTKSEAKYLKDTITNRLKIENKDSLLLLLLQNVDLGLRFLSSESFYDFFKNNLENIRISEVKERVENANKFSFFMYGAHLLYNLMLQEKIENSTLVEKYKIDFDAWLRDAELVKYDYIEHFKGIYEIRNTSNNFVEEWLSLISQKNIEELKELIKKQELRSKGQRARLSKDKLPPEVFSREWYGMKYQDYRFKQVKDILTDIYKGFGYVE